MIESVIIVGGGASAVAAAVALAGQTNSESAPALTVVSRDPHVGLGLAYGRAGAHHLLNSPAGKMSITAAADDFVRWAADSGITLDPNDFARRRLYGEYLSSRFSALVDQKRVDVLEGDAASVEVTAASARVVLADGHELSADAIVLALGNPPPALAALDAVTISTNIRRIPDPWIPAALETIDASDRVLLVGTGLTMVDVATSLARRLPGVRLTATSRHLLLPKVHPEHPATPTAGVGIPDGPATLGAVASSVGTALRDAAADGIPWQAVIDGMRPQLSTLWRKLSVKDRGRFISRFGRQWEVHRHRMAPAVHAELDELLEAGTLTLDRSGELNAGEFDVAVNCTGPRAFSDRGWSELVDSLLATELARPDALGLGLDVTAAGALVRADGTASDNVFALGPALRGTLYETTAVPEIRQQATALAAYLAQVGREVTPEIPEASEISEASEIPDTEGAR